MLTHYQGVHGGGGGGYELFWGGNRSLLQFIMMLHAWRGSASSNDRFVFINVYIALIWLLSHRHNWSQPLDLFPPPYGLTTLSEPKSKGGWGGYWLESPYPNCCFKWLSPLLCELGKYRNVVILWINGKQTLFSLSVIWGITVMWDSRMDTGGEKDFCLFWDLGKLDLLPHMGA